MSNPAISAPLPEHVAFVAVHRDELDELRVLPEEEALLHPRSTPVRKTSFRLGRIAAHLALEQLLGHASPVLRGHHRQPEWPLGIVGSITHTDAYGLAAVARLAECAGVGIDLERRRPIVDLIGEFATPAEAARIERLAPDARSDVALALFSAKEAIYKAFFPRIEQYFGFGSVDLTWHPSAQYFVAHFVEPLDPGYPPDRRFVVDCRWFGELVLTTLALPPAG